MGKQSEAYMARFYQKSDFCSIEKARSIFEFLKQQDSLFLPVRYDRWEPLRKEFDPDHLEEPIEMLRGPQRKAGGLYVRAKKFRFLMRIGWVEENPFDRWDIHGSANLFEVQSRTDKFVEFVTGLTEHTMCHYGVVGLWSDWTAKNWVLTWKIDQKTGEQVLTGESKYGMSLQTGLMGVHWITVLGPQLVEHFGGIARMQQLDVFHCHPLSYGGVLLQSRESPLEPEQPKRLEHDRRIVEDLGADYFFDIREPERSATPIPGFTGPDAKSEI